LPPPPPPTPSPLSLHDALPISELAELRRRHEPLDDAAQARRLEQMCRERALHERQRIDPRYIALRQRAPRDHHLVVARAARGGGDRKRTRLNSSQVAISYAVFC